MTTRKHSSSCTWLTPFFACLLAFQSIAFAQGQQRPKPPDYAIIFGTVWGPDDRALPAIRVKMRRAEEKKTRWETYANRRGEFEFRVAPSKQDYVIWAETKGYKTPSGRHLQPSPEVTVHIEKDERADTGLHLK